MDEYLDIPQFLRQGGQVEINFNREKLEEIMSKKNCMNCVYLDNVCGSYSEFHVDIYTCMQHNSYGNLLSFPFKKDMSCFIPCIRTEIRLFPTNSETADYVREQMEPATGVYLANFADNCGIERKYHGDSEKKPVKDCFYDENSDCPGWYETDNSLRKRIIDSFKT